MVAQRLLYVLRSFPSLMPLGEIIHARFLSSCKKTDGVSADHFDVVPSDPRGIFRDMPSSKDQFIDMIPSLIGERYFSDGGSLSDPDSFSDSDYLKISNNKLLGRILYLKESVDEIESLVSNNKKISSSEYSYINDEISKIGKSLSGIQNHITKNKL